MSYDLAVWEGSVPSSDGAALDEYKRMMDQWQGDGTPPYAEPSAAIRAYVEALLARWPDITTDEGEDSPWADGPLIGNATGPLFYFAMTWSGAEAGTEFAASVANARGLVCFDPQTETLRPH